MKPSFGRKFQSNSIHDPRSSQPLNKFGNNVEHCSLHPRIKNIVMATDQRLGGVTNLTVTPQAKEARLTVILTKEAFYLRMNAIKPKRWNQPHARLLTHSTQQRKAVFLIERRITCPPFPSWSSSSQVGLPKTRPASIDVDCQAGDLLALETLGGLP
jgi:hypothetical protein